MSSTSTRLTSENLDFRIKISSGVKCVQKSVFAICCLAVSLLASEDLAAPRQLDHLTAEEMLKHADKFFQQQQFDQAGQLYAAFLEQYGKAAEVKDHLIKIRAHAVISLARSGRSEEALQHYQANDAAVLEPPPLQLAWLVAVCQTHLALQDFEKGRSLLGQIFQHPSTQNTHREEVIQMAFQSFGAEEKWEEAIAFYEKHRVTFGKAQQSTQEQAQLFYLQALLRCERWDLATQTLQSMPMESRSAKVWVHTQSFRWQVAEALLAQENWEPCAQMLLGIRPLHEILQKLQRSIEDSERKLPSDRSTKNPTYVRLLQDHEELLAIQKTFEGFTDFDAIVRFRLASCFQALERYREAAFVLDHMIRQMEASEVTESASASLLRLWMIQERWTRAVRSAELYEQRFEGFAETPNRAEILFLKGQAYQGLGHFEEAAQAFATVAQQFPEHEWSEQARFMEAHQYLHLNQEEMAIEKFSALQGLRSPELQEESEYWLGMAYYFSQRWSEAREQFDAYLGRGSFEMYRRDVEYRVAYTHFSEAHYQDAIELLLAWQRRHPQTVREDALAEEVLLTLGDAYGAIGELDQAVRTYETLTSESATLSFYDEAQFKIANVHKVLKEEEAYVRVLEAFLERRPQSPKLPEALHALGKYHRSKNQNQRAQQLFWDSLIRLGNLEDQEGLEEMMLTLLQWQNKASFQEFDRNLDQKIHEAILLKQQRWLQRLWWFQWAAHDKFQTPELASHLQGWLKSVKKEECSPRVLLDLAKAYQKEKQWSEAKLALNTLRKYYPKSLYKDQAWLGLAKLALQEKAYPEAVKSFEKFYRYTLAPKIPVPDSPIQIVEGPEGGDAMLRWAQCCLKGSEDQQQHGEQLHLAIIKHKKYPAVLKAETLFSHAEFLSQKSRHREAIVFFEQVYLLYPSHQPYAAQSYLGRANCLKNLQLYRQAREVYEALLALKDEAYTAYHIEARQGLSELPLVP